MKLSNIVLYSVIGILLILAIVIGYVWYNQYYGSDYQKALQSELPDKCATPPGYTDESWREHMSHHPDQYRECLK